MLASHRWTRWFIRRVIEFGRSFISKSQKGHRAGTNVRQTMSALRWRGKWKVGSNWTWKSRVHNRIPQSNVAPEVQEDQGLIMSAKASLKVWADFRRGKVTHRWQNNRLMLWLWMILCRFTWCDAVLWFIQLYLSSYIKTKNKRSNLFIFLQSCDKRHYFVVSNSITL